MKEERRRKELVEVRKIKGEESSRKVTVKVGLERIDIQKGIIVEVLLDSRAVNLFISTFFSYFYFYFYLFSYFQT